MAYENPSGLNNNLATSDLEDFADLPEPAQDRLLRTAHRTVRGLAPPPDPIDEDYREAARDAEVAVIGFMLRTDGGVLKSASLSGVDNESYVGLDAVQRIVAAAMGSYYVGEVSPVVASGAGDSATVFNVSDEPLF